MLYSVLHKMSSDIARNCCVGMWREDKTRTQRQTPNRARMARRAKRHIARRESGGKFPRSSFLLRDCHGVITEHKRIPFLHLLRAFPHVDLFSLSGTQKTEVNARKR